MAGYKVVNHYILIFIYNQYIITLHTYIPHKVLKKKALKPSCKALQLPVLFL